MKISNKFLNFYFGNNFLVITTINKEILYKFRAFCFLLSCILASSPNYAGNFENLVLMDTNLEAKEFICEKVDGFCIAEGDIILKKEEKRNPLGAKPLLKMGGERWPNGIIPFQISVDLSKTKKIEISEAIAAWEKNTRLKFIELTEENLDAFPDYIYFMPTTGKTSSSFVGKQGGLQEIKLTSTCKVMSIAHEIGHALGLWHEQSRADRDQYIKIIWDNIAEQHIFNFQQHLTDGFDFGEYDYQSVMHYTAYAFSKNGQKTIIPIVDGVEIGQRSHLSDKDIDTINFMYP